MLNRKLFFNKKQENQQLIPKTEHEQYLPTLRQYIQEHFSHYNIQCEDINGSLWIKIKNGQETMGTIRIETEYDRGIAYRIRIKGLDISAKYRKNGYATILVELATYYAKEIRKTPQIVAMARAGGGENALTQDQLETFYRKHVPGIELE